MGEMAGGGVGFGPAEGQLLLGEAAGDARIFGDEERGGGAGVGDEPVHHFDQLGLVVGIGEEAALQALGGVGQEVAVDDVAGLLHVHGEDEDLLEAALVVLAEGFRVERREVALDGGVEAIEHVVAGAGFGDELAVAAGEGLAGAGQHGFECIGEAQGLAGGAADGDDGRLAGGTIEIERLARIGGVGAIGDEAFEKTRDRREQGQGEGGEQQVEAKVEGGDGGGAGEAEGGQGGEDRVDQQPGEHEAEDAVAEIGEGDAAGGRIVAGGFEQGIERGAEVGADHQHQGGFERDDAARGERHHQQDDGDARMGGPGGEGAEDDGDEGQASEKAEEFDDLRGVLERFKQGEHLVEREDHQAEADEDAAEVVQHGAAVAAEEQDAEEDQGRREQRDVEGQDGDDERGADIGAEHDGHGGDEADKAAGGKVGGHEACGGARLE
jgi:hypothetical protein